jgi:hypothetical protein
MPSARVNRPLRQLLPGWLLGLPTNQPREPLQQRHGGVPLGVRRLELLHSLRLGGSLLIRPDEDQPDGAGRGQPAAVPAAYPTGVGERLP